MAQARDVIFKATQEATVSPTNYQSNIQKLPIAEIQPNLGEWAHLHQWEIKYSDLTAAESALLFCHKKATSPYCPHTITVSRLNIRGVT